MFSSDSQLARDNQASLRRAMLLALPFCLAVLLPIVSGRLTVVGWALIVLSTLVVALMQRQRRPDTLTISWLEISIAAFCAFARPERVVGGRSPSPARSGFVAHGNCRRHDMDHSHDPVLFPHARFFT